ncbi:tetratricopeptide repeat protein, partial [Zoogloea sp.]|uniref:tetratricopeptide repeat protein n=1 Tax=Zoogloea sp. TaxID=49181 RepID=UPI001AD199FA
MNRHRVLTLALLGCVLLPPAPGLAAPVSTIDADAEQKTLVDRLVLDRATTLATGEKRAFDRERTLLAQLDERDKQLRRSLAQRKQSEADAASARAELLQVTAERERLVADIAARDATYRAELAEYRRIIASLASSPSEDRRQALERYADGDRFGAFPVLEALTRAEEAAREKANKLKAAEEYRQLAALAADMKDRGEKTTDEVVRLWQAAAERDPGDLWTWIFLARLHQEAGQTDKAGDAAARALHAANQPRDRSVALNTLGDVQVAAGDLAAARRSFEDSLQIARRLAAANPGSAEAQRDVSVSLEKLGDVHVAAGELTAARTSFEASLQIARRLAAANPGSAEAQRDVSVSLKKLGDVHVAAGDLAAARKSFEDSLQIARRLAAANPGSAEAQRDVSVSLIKLGDVQVTAGDLAAARR